MSGTDGCRSHAWSSIPVGRDHRGPASTPTPAASWAGGAATCTPTNLDLDASSSDPDPTTQPSQTCSAKPLTGQGSAIHVSRLGRAAQSGRFDAAVGGVGDALNRAPAESVIGLFARG